MRRWMKLIVVGLTLAAFALIVPPSSAQQQALGLHGRFDLISIVPANTTLVAVAGGTDQGKDSSTGDTVDLTGSGDFKPGQREAAGGGKFVHKHSGTAVASGAWVVTSFVSWTPTGGTLACCTDGIGEVSQTSGGILALNVRLISSTETLDGILEIHCTLHGSSQTTEEGIQLAVSGVESFVFEQNGGFTLFHILQ